MSALEPISAGYLIDALGGTAAVARLLSVSASAVSNCRARNAFPANTFLVMSGALDAVGLIAPPQLWGMRLPIQSSSSVATIHPVVALPLSSDASPAPDGRPLAYKGAAETAP